MIDPKVVREAAEAFPPGETIVEEMQARGWTQAELAGAMHTTVRDLELLLKGERKLWARDAEHLAHAFGTSTTLWLNLERHYRRWEAVRGSR